MTKELSEQILDSFLEELLSGQSPPNLSRRIEAAWKREKARRMSEAGRGSLVVAELVEEAPQTPTQEHSTPDQTTPEPSNAEMSAAEAASQPTSGSKAVDASIRHRPQSSPRSTGHGSTHPPTRRPKTEAAAMDGRAQRRPASRSFTTSRQLLATLAALAACTMLALLTWQRTAPRSTPPLASDDARGQLQPNKGLDGMDVAAGQPPSLSPSTVPPASPSASEVLDIGDLPFASQSPAGEAASATPNAPAASIASLPASAVITQIDQRLAEAWKSLGIVGSQRLPPAARAQRISQVLTGQPLPPADELSATEGDLQPIIQEQLNSRAFARRWADQFVQQWLAGGSLPLKDPQVEQLQQELTHHIAAAQPWNEVALTLFGGEILAGTTSATTTLLSSWGGGGNHRLVSRLGTNFLDSNLSCVRCHDALGGPSPNGLEKQEVYWSLVAMLYGLDARGSAQRQERTVIDRQGKLLAENTVPPVYYDLLDGRLQAAEPRLPSGEAWTPSDTVQVPRQALAVWLSQSPQLDKATVNQVWKMLFGRYLVPQVGGLDDLALAQRRSLQDYLAQQFRAHDRDLKQLVGWLVQSDAFARQPIRLERSQWLNASEEQLKALRDAQVLFAAGPTLPLSETPLSLERALLAVIDWQGKSGQPADSTVTLAQPVPSSKPAASLPPAASKLPEFDPAASSYAVHGERPLAAEIAFVQQLLQAERLNWEQRVEHIVALDGGSPATKRIQKLAADLLEQHDGDAQAALLDLLWAVTHAD
ncbi:MAG: DUF1553 domain-containing protein [Planctomycetales bacterium]|nr:DUF1553 domain-containing protein [Planctomycetales bacterium]